jgi:Na+/Pi-cotransporter
MSTSSVVAVVGGLGLFLLGIHHLTEGLKGLAGDSLRRTLQAMVGGRLSAIVSGALFTVLIQSSTATTLTVIGFVSGGLVTFSQAVGSSSVRPSAQPRRHGWSLYSGFACGFLPLRCRWLASVPFSG